MQGDIVYLKLVTGEDIVAYVDVADDEYISIHQPIQFFTYNTTEGAVVRSAKWIPFSKETEIVLRARHVILSLKPTKDIRDYYLEILDILEQNENPESEEQQEAEDYIRALFERHSNTSITVH